MAADVRGEVGLDIDPVRSIETTGHGDEPTTEHVEPGQTVGHECTELVHREGDGIGVESHDTHTLEMARR